MTEEDLAEMLVKKVQENPNPKLTINGGETLNPIVEALFAVFREQLSDEEIMRIANAQKDIRRVLAVDSIVDYIPQNKREEFRAKIRPMNSYEEIIKLAALYISEDKRIMGGKVLQNLPDIPGLNEHFPRSLFGLNMADFYIEGSAEKKIEENIAQIKKEKKRRKIKKRIATAVLAAAIGLGGYFLPAPLGIKDDIYMLLNKNYFSYKTHRLSDQISALEAELQSEKGLKRYVMSSDEFNKPGEPDIILKEMEEIQKYGEMKRVIFFYQGKDMDKVEFVYAEKKP